MRILLIAKANKIVTMPSYLPLLFWPLLAIGTALAQESHLPLRALWGFEPVEEFSGTLEQTVRALQDHLVNAIFVSQIAPELRGALQDSGIKVFTTVNVFGDNSLWKKYPQLRPVDQNGQPLPAEPGNGICPTQRWYWPRIHRDLVKKKEDGFDGLWLDFIRFSGKWEEHNPQFQQNCFCDSTLVDFAKTIGFIYPVDTIKIVTSFDSVAVDSFEIQEMTSAQKASFILSRYGSAWSDYKRNTIADFVRQTRAKLGEDPGFILGAFTVPFTREEYGYAITTVLAQDYRRLSDHLDILSPMLYHELCGRSTDWIGEFVKYAANETNKCIVPIIQSDLGEEHRVTDDEFAAAVLTALESPSAGVIIFRQQTLLAARQLRMLKAAWQ